MNNQPIINKKILIGITVFFAVILVISIGASIHNISVKKEQAEISAKRAKDYDPATEQEITTFTGYTPPEGQRTIFVGFEAWQNGSETAVYDEFTSLRSRIALAKYNGKELSRVSMYKRSFKRTMNEETGNWEITFKFAVNKDQGDFFAKIIKESYFRFTIYIYEDEAMTKELLQQKYCDPTVCSDTRNIN